MSSYDRSIDIQETHAKMHRVGCVKSIIDAIGDDKLTRPEVAARTDMPECKLKHLLPELREYNILSGTQESKDNMMLYSLKKPSKIERLKDDMMGATA